MAWQPLRALAHRNFRLFFGGQTISLIGTWMQQVAMSWLVFVMTGSDTGSAFWLGVIGFASQIPSFFVAPLAGVLVDRWNRHRLLLATQSLAMLQAFVLAALALSGEVQIWQVVALSVVLGLVNAFDMTGRQAFLTEMVQKREDIANAVALNSSMVNGTRLIGPALAGMLLSVTSAGVCFLVNGVSYFAVLVALLAMQIAPRLHQAAHPPILHGLWEGVRYAFGFAPIRAILLLLSLVSMTGLSYMVLMPVFATTVLHGGADTYGWLQSAAGLGALVGAIFLATRHSVLGLGRWLVITPALFGLGLIAFSFSTSLWLSLLLLLVTGFAMMVQMAASNTLLQTLAEEDKRGRVMSFYTMAFLGVAPIGSLLAGWLASRIGAPETIRLGGLCCLVGAGWFALALPRLRAIIRPIYVQMGILPEIMAGLPGASEPEASATGQVVRR